MGAGRVRQDQSVLAIGMFEEIEDAFFLHQPGDEIEVGFPVLDAIVALGITLRQFELEIAATPVAKNVLNNIGNDFLLENPTIGGEGLNSTARAPARRDNGRSAIPYAPARTG